MWPHYDYFLVEQECRQQRRAAAARRKARGARASDRASRSVAARVRAAAAAGLRPLAERLEGGGRVPSGSPLARPPGAPPEG